MQSIGTSTQKELLDQPLAARMRPREINEIAGQEHLFGDNGLLRGMLKHEAKLPSLILWGPPGVGKTTLAQILCGQAKGEFVHLSAVLAGVKDIREVVEKANALRASAGIRMYLFIDEIHRFNKSQQDALLPHVEAGTVTLFGATTENPSFSVIAPLLSRCRVLVLKPLESSHLRKLAHRALQDVERGLGARGLHLDSNAEDLLVESAAGDARAFLTTLEIAADLAQLELRATISESDVRTAACKRMLQYDRNGEQHYDVISAFIKSLRGSDPDAACHYLVRMVESGEDPRFIFRRMIVFASEDIGNADPQAIQVAVSTFQAYELMGMPEGYLPLTHAATYLASAPKSNAVIKAYNAAKADLEKPGASDVPLHLRNAPTGLMKKLGYGKEYQYPHNFPGNFVKQQYLPDALVGARYYNPTENGYERFIAQRLKHGVLPKE